MVDLENIDVTKSLINIANWIENEESELNNLRLEYDDDT